MRYPKRNKFDEKKDINIKSVKYTQSRTPGQKPNGFWYACHKSWTNALILHEMGGFHKYLHKITIKRGVLTDIKNPDPDTYSFVERIC